jgi:hypothetical protein
MNLRCRDICFLGSLFEQTNLSEMGDSLCSVNFIKLREIRSFFLVSQISLKLYIEDFNFYLK